LLALALEIPSLPAAREKLPTLATSKKVFRRLNPSIKHPGPLGLTLWTFRLSHFSF
jgi:hypothetical protein